MNEQKESPLWTAIKFRDRAVRKKAHPRIIARLESRVREEAAIVAEILTTDVINQIVNQRPV